MAKKTTSNKKTKPAVKNADAKSHSTEDKRPNRTNVWKRLAFVGGSVVILVLFAIVGFFVFEYLYQNKVYPGVMVDGRSMSGFTYDQVVSELKKYKEQLNSEGLQFTYSETAMHLDTSMADETAQVDVPLVEFDVDATAQAVYGVGRSNDTLADVRTKVQGWFSPVDIEPRVTIDTAAITALLEAKFTQYETEPVDAQLSYDVGGISIIPHSNGEQFSWDAVTNQIADTMMALDSVRIDLQLQPEPAAVSAARAEELKPAALAILEQAPLTLRYQDREFTVEQEELQGWLTLSPDQVIFNHEAVDASLDIIAGEIDVPVKEGRYTVYKEGDALRLEQFEQGEPGLGVNVEKSIAVIEEAVLENKAASAELVVEVVEPRATPDNLESLGIKELLGTGTTSFAGSPSNRIGNIQKGADMLHGLLIAPGEEFSLVEALAPIDLAHGWLSELVIKGNKLEKEAGGGLCQIGSTIFRATMMAGLKITERHSHSWAVSYYNYNGKAGVDATIYEPSPDYRFVNDTENWVLIQSRIEGANLYFDFYGTSDGRNGYFTEPVNYAYVSPGPTEEIVDESLPEGARECPQHAFTGVSASFDYIIERADGTVDTTTFTSTYRAQAARCLVGPEPKEESPPAEETNDNADQNDNQNTNDQNTPDKKDDPKKKKKNSDKN